MAGYCTGISQTSSTGFGRNVKFARIDVKTVPLSRNATCRVKRRKRVDACSRARNQSKFQYFGQHCIAAYEIVEVSRDLHCSSSFVMVSCGARSFGNSASFKAALSRYPIRMSAVVWSFAAWTSFRPPFPQRRWRCRMVRPPPVLPQRGRRSPPCHARFQR